MHTFRAVRTYAISRRGYKYIGMLLYVFLFALGVGIAVMDIDPSCSRPSPRPRSRAFCLLLLPTLWQLEKSAVYPGAGGRMADSWDEVAVKELSRHPRVERAFGLGSVLAVEMKAANRG